MLNPLICIVGNIIFGDESTESCGIHTESDGTSIKLNLPP